MKQDLSKILMILTLSFGLLTKAADSEFKIPEITKTTETISFFNPDHINASGPIDSLREVGNFYESLESTEPLRLQIYHKTKQYQYYNDNGEKRGNPIQLTDTEYDQFMKLIEVIHTRGCGLILKIDLKTFKIISGEPGEFCRI